MLHVSEYDHRRIENIADVLKVGETVKFQILDVDQKTGKMKLSRRAITAKPDGTMPTDEENAARANRGGGGDRGGSVCDPGGCGIEVGGLGGSGVAVVRGGGAGGGAGAGR